MRVGIPKETAPGELRVALVPEAIHRLPAGVGVIVEPGAGAAAGFDEKAYIEAGADLGDPWDAEVVVKVARPADDERARLRPGQLLIGFLQPLGDPEWVETLSSRGVDGIALE